MTQNKPVHEQVLEIGSRLKTAPSQLLIDTVFAYELEQERQLFQAVGLVDIAHTFVGMELGQIPQAAAYDLLKALLELQKTADFNAIAEYGDIYTNREAWLAQHTDSVHWLGAGRARREAITTGFMLVLRDGLLQLSEALITCINSFANKALHHQQSLIPDYTYLQAAQPTSFGHYLLGSVFPLLRDLERLTANLAELEFCPAGCGSNNGSRLPQGRERLAELLGFNAPSHHARDSMWQADIMLHIAALLVSISITLSRLAEDLQIFTTEEFGLLVLHDSHARASKIMPQKKNPFALTYIRGLANQMIALQTLIATTARTPSGQPDNRISAYGELPKAIQQLSGSLQLMAEVINLLSFDEQRAASLCQQGWLMATDLCEALSQKNNLDFRSCHQLVGFLASCYRNAYEITPEIVAETAQKLLGKSISLSAEELKNYLNPELALTMREEIGGTAPHCIEQMLLTCETFLQEQKSNIQIYATQFNEAECKLMSLVNDFLNCLNKRYVS